MANQNKPVPWFDFKYGAISGMRRWGWGSLGATSELGIRNIQLIKVLRREVTPPPSPLISSFYSGLEPK